MVWRGDTDRVDILSTEDVAKIKCLLAAVEGAFGIRVGGLDSAVGVLPTRAIDFTDCHKLDIRLTQ